MPPITGRTTTSDVLTDLVAFEILAAAYTLNRLVNVEEYDNMRLNDLGAWAQVHERLLEPVERALSKVGTGLRGLPAHPERSPGRLLVLVRRRVKRAFVVFEFSPLETSRLWPLLPGPGEFAAYGHREPPLTDDDVYRLHVERWFA